MSSSPAVVGRAAGPAPAGAAAAAAAAPGVTAKSVSATLADLRSAGRTAFIPYLCAGDPGTGADASPAKAAALDRSLEALVALDGAGASIVEFGVPYSDAGADGPVIASAATRAVELGVSFGDVLGVVARAAPRMTAPLLLFVYYNQLAARGGLEESCRRIAEAGARALLCPDVALEETGALRAAAEKAGLEFVLLTTPTTPIEREREIAAATRGFLYVVSVAGVTGTRDALAASLPARIQELKSITDVPLCVGFGVSTPDQAAQVARTGADGVIVGSALVRELAGNGVQAAGNLAKAMVDHIAQADAKMQ